MIWVKPILRYECQIVNYGTLAAASLASRLFFKWEKKGAQK